MSHNTKIRVLMLASAWFVLGIVVTNAAALESAEIADWSGRLTLAVESAQVSTTVLRDDVGVSQNPLLKWDTLPDLSLAFVHSGEFLIPLSSGAIPSDHPNWEWVITSGQVEQINSGARISIPVALMEKNENCLHNGVLTTTLTPEKPMSMAQLEFASETCQYFKFDLSASVKMHWQTEPKNTTRAKRYRAEFDRERATTIPIKPIQDLLTKYPMLDNEGIAESTTIAPKHMSHYGVIIEDAHYASGCNTRAGQYRHCDQMAMPSYSWAKSVVASFALMRLESLYPGTSQQKISNYVPQCTGAAWRDVRFIDALNMQTGNYESQAMSADEASPGYQPFFLATTHAEKITFACEYFSRKSKPGTEFVYHTSDTYILGTAMAAFWKEQKGDASDFFKDLIINDIFTPLGLSATAKWIRRSNDEAAQPFTGWGLILNRNDIAKLLSFLSGTNPYLSPQSVFNHTDLNIALAGLSQGSTNTSSVLAYRRGFWAYNLQHKTACSTPVWIPFMSGYGGLSAAIVSPQMAYYNVSDGGQHAFANALVELNKITPLCGKDD